MDRHLTLETKRLVYHSVMLGVLLYGAETGAPTQVLVKKLEWFHRHCIRCIMGIGRTVQWAKHITTVELAERFGMRESICDLLGQYRLRWLGHLARMSNSRIPKRLLFGWLLQKHPAHGAKLRWWDKVRQDLKTFNVPETSWYIKTQEHSVWRNLCSEGSLQLLVASIGPSVLSFECIVCRCQFRRSQDIVRHKCVTTRSRTGCR